MRGRNCGAENRAGRKFCADCGAPLSVTCGACEGREVFERLQARPWLEQLDAALPSLARVHAQAT